MWWKSKIKVNITCEQDRCFFVSVNQAVIRSKNIESVKLLFKGTVHPKIKSLSSFTHPHVNPNLYDFFLLWNTTNILNNEGNQTVSVTIDFHCIYNISQTIFFMFHSGGTSSYRFGITWGWVNTFAVLGELFL